MMQMVFLVLCIVLFLDLVSSASSVEKHRSSDEKIVPHSGLYQDPVDFFLGSKKRPRLEIISPKQGAVLEHGVLDIEIAIHYPKTDMQSVSNDGRVSTGIDNEEQQPLHGSALCLSVATSQGQESEDCFHPTERIFHAGGLAAGETYTIKFTLFERNQAIAASLRTVRVVGILAVPYVSEVMTIHSALQVAAQYALRGMENAAEDIYKSILAESPFNPQALHNIGAMYYQKGDSVKATEFVERALQHQGNYSLTGFHNTLGICYKTLGRLEEAEKQFRVAMEIDPSMLGAKYNLGLLLQAQKRWSEAIELYQTVLLDNQNLNANNPNNMFPEEFVMDSAVRTCDLLQAQQRYDEAIKCWQQGIQRYPAHYIFYEELGGLLAQLRMYDNARFYMSKALELGHLPAEEKLAQILESMGEYTDAQQALMHCLQRAQAMQPTPARHSHLLIRNATLLPKIVPSRDTLQQLRMEQLAVLESDGFFAALESENASPHNLGFSLGFEYLFHDTGSNVPWKQALQEVYLRFCPALKQGYFLVHPEQRTVEQEIERVDEGALAVTDKRQLTNIKKQETEKKDSIPVIDATNIIDEEQPSSISDNNKYNADITKDITETYNEELQTKGALQESRIDLSGDGAAENKRNSSLGDNDHKKNIDNESNNNNNNKLSPWLLTATRLFPERPARIVFVSRFFFHHQCGLLSAGLIELLAGKISLSLEPLLQQYHLQEVQQRQFAKVKTSTDYFAKFFEVHVVFLEGGTNTSIYHDHLQARLLRIASPHVHALRFIDNVQQITSYLRQVSPDVLIYPELGLDAFTYFTAFARLAPVQAMWLCHPDTSGLDTIDYFLTTSTSSPTYNSHPHQQYNNDVPVKERHFLEKEYAFTHFGTIFLDLYESRATLQRQSPRTIQLNRAKFLEQTHWPKNAHLYMIPYSPSKLHPDFDALIIQLLTRDKIGLIVIAEVGRPSSTFQRLFLARLQEKLTNNDQNHHMNNNISNSNMEQMLTRILFPEIHSPLEMTAMIQMADVVLEPFPLSGGFDMPLSALAMGVPVVTMPHSTHIAGRLCLALYDMLDYGISNTVPTVSQVNNDTVITAANNTDNIDTVNGVTTNNDTNTTVAELAHNTTTNNSKINKLYTRLVVETFTEYFETAMKLAHHPRMREYHTQQLLQRREKFFRVNVWRLAEEWKRFVFGALHNRTLEASKTT